MNVATHYRLLVFDVWFKNASRRNSILINPKIKWWRLKGTRLTFKDKVIEDPDWNLKGMQTQCDRG